MTKRPEEYEQFVLGNLAGRVYGDGRVVIAHLFYDNSSGYKAKFETEITLDTKTAREFCEKLAALIAKQQGGL